MKSGFSCSYASGTLEFIPTPRLCFDSSQNSQKSVRSFRRHGKGLGGQLGPYRVLRRLAQRRGRPPSDGNPTKTALFVDVETTGLDPSRDEVIELAMVPFTYGLDGQIYEIGEPFQRFRQPSRSIPAEITKRIDQAGAHKPDGCRSGYRPAEVATFAKDGLVVAHNAGFDRRFVERVSDVFAKKPWACSMSQMIGPARGMRVQTALPGR